MFEHITVGFYFIYFIQLIYYDCGQHFWKYYGRTQGLYIHEHIHEHLHEHVYEHIYEHIYEHLYEHLYDYLGGSAPRKI